MSRKPTVGYWDIRGYGQPIRLLLAYAGVDFTDRRYRFGVNLDRSEWLNEKYTLGLDFPNLPYYIDENVRLSQSLAILRYLGRKHNLSSKNELEETRISLIEQQLRDMVKEIGDLSFDSRFIQLKPKFVKKLPGELKLLSKFLSDNPYIIGKNICYVDFCLYEYLSILKTLLPELFELFDNLKNYHQRFESLPAIADYIKKQKPALFNGPAAVWDGYYA